MAVLCTSDFMESDENMGGKTGINEEDLGGIWKENLRLTVAKVRAISETSP
jgi:hypothetical protein